LPAKILVVEDDADQRQLLVLMLKWEGYTIFTAGDGNEGLEKARENAPDLIISDITMPNLDGITMVQALRDMPDFKRTPILMVSAYGSGNLRDALNAGANQIMRKPLDFSALMTTIRELQGFTQNL
jgi:CheY-like chemotaxis protein